MIKAYKKTDGSFYDTNNKDKRLYLPGDVKIVDDENSEHTPIPKAFLDTWDEIPIPQDYLDTHYETIKKNELGKEKIEIPNPDEVVVNNTIEVLDNNSLVDKIKNELDLGSLKSVVSGKEEPTELPEETDDIKMFIKQPAERAGWYNIVDVETGDKKNGNPLKNEDADKLLEKLSQ